MAITVHGSLAEACTQWTQMREGEGRSGEEVKKVPERERKREEKKPPKGSRWKREGSEEKRWQQERDIISCRYYNEVISERL